MYVNVHLTPPPPPPHTHTHTHTPTNQKMTKIECSQIASTPLRGKLGLAGLKHHNTLFSDYNIFSYFFLERDKFISRIEELKLKLINYLPLVVSHHKTSRGGGGGLKQ